MTEENPRISRGRAIYYVGRAKYGEDWIGSPTPKEEDIIAEYGEGRASKPSSIMPGMITYMSTDGAFRGWPPYHGNSEVANEIDRAQHRNRLIDRQYQWAREWMEDHGFDLDADDFSFDEFYKELKKDFPHVRLRSANARELRTSDRPQDEQAALIAALGSSPATQLPAVVEPPRAPDDAGSTAPESLPKPSKGGRPGDLGDRYRAEFRQRRKEGIPLCASKAAEAAAIVAALQERGELPKNPSPSVKTAENAITEMYNKAKAGLNAA